MYLRRYCIRSVKRLNHTWVKPEGYDTGIKIFNCTTKHKEPLIVKNKNLVTWYTCGPTVYDSAHAGHASSYVKFDIIQTVLREHFGLNLVTVMNITDVDDKIISRSNALKIPIQELTQRYETEFFADLAALHVRKPDCVIRVTENIQIIIDFIKKIVDKKLAYKSQDGSVYFDVEKYGNYGKLQNLGEDHLTEESVIFGNMKKNPTDFALWKAAKPGEIFWKSPWGDGRPGWHIECSALASHILGPNIDIHAGGVDLRFPHHENEEAQCCAYHDRLQWVNYWLHTGHLHQKDAVKMSKSLKNTVSIGDLLKDTSSEVFRMACCMSHYRSPMIFSTEFMSTAGDQVKIYKNFFDTCDDYIKGYLRSSVDRQNIEATLTEASEQVHQALTDDFNTPKVVKILNDLCTKINSQIHSSTDTGKSAHASNYYGHSSVIASQNFLSHALNLFGLDLKNRGVSDVTVDSENEKFSEVMKVLNGFRQDVRQLGIDRKDQNILKLCDSVRDSLRTLGITIKDHGKVSSWST